MIACESHGAKRRNFKDAGRVCPIDYHLDERLFSEPSALSADVLYARQGTEVDCALGVFELPDLPPDAPASGMLVARPEAACNVGSGALHGCVADATFRGMSVGATVECNGAKLALSLPLGQVPPVGDELHFDLDPALLWFVADDGDLAYSGDA